MVKQWMHFKAELVLILVTILAGFGWIFSKEALTGLPPLFFMGMRFLVACFVLVLAGRKYFVGLRWRDMRPALLVGGVMGLAMMFWVEGLSKTQNLGVGAFIASLGVVLVPIVAKLLFKEQPPKSIWVALPIAVIGLAFLALDGGLKFEVGQLFFLATAVMSAFQFNLLSRQSTRMPVLVLTAIQLGVAGVFLLTISMLTETVPHAVPTNVVGWFLASTLIATSLRFLLQTYGQSLTPVSHAAVIMNLEPVWTALFASIWFAQLMSVGQVFGCILIFVAMLMSRWRQIRMLFKSH